MQRSQTGTRQKARRRNTTMKTLDTFKAVLVGSFVTLVTVGAMPAFAATLDDQQAPRGDFNATLNDQQAPRGEDTQASATLDDQQAPRGQDTQASATLDDQQAPRSARQ
jgi:hypothetical protein